jgi:hypothetical protein
MKYPEPLGDTVIVSDELIKEAQEVLRNGDGTLPVCLSTDMNIWVAYLEDETVEGVPFSFQDNSYKIGFKNVTLGNE